MGKLGRLNVKCPECKEEFLEVHKIDKELLTICSNCNYKKEFKVKEFMC